MTTDLQKSFKEQMDYDELMNCTRCGFCLPSCPTYINSGQNEASSPRGRIALMKGVVEGRIEPDEKVEQQLNECLGCRACEPVCPSGVQYGHLLEQARTVINEHKSYSLPVKMLRKATFNYLFMSSKRMHRVHQLRWLYEKTLAQKLVRASKLLTLFPGEVETMERVVPKTVPPKRLNEWEEVEKGFGKQTKRVAFFNGCLMGTMFYETNQSTRLLLKTAGCEIVTPKKQECCGALHAHGGETEKAIQLAKRNIEAFENLDVDAVISNAGGCGAGLKDYPFLLRKEADWEKRAKAFSDKVTDISTLLASLDLGPLELSDEVVTYQPSCHLENVMKEKGNVEKLLRKVNGIEYVAMVDKDKCCGSAGIYNLVQPKMAMRILDQKMVDVAETNASVIVTSNPGCLLQMKAGIERERLTDSVRAVHIVDLLADAIRKRDSEEGDAHAVRNRH
ncbi:(Fe-S)-binding protein [Alteribacter aurantiacus]|uniref:(Fe-S)-binding protein n=1 Tax=Alteribacter aurantiacus TaxID=254410 RepID=UPI00047A8522|nr:(Fe-S)-binding protein [Alteribacter aurantiacus]